MNTMHKMKSIFGPVVTKKNLYSECSEDIPGEFFCTRGGGSRQRRRLPIDAITLKPVSAPAYKDPVTKRSLTLKTLREWVKTNPSDPLTRRAYSQEELGIINGTEAYTYDREHGWEWSEVWLAPEIDRFVCKMWLRVCKLVAHISRRSLSFVRRFSSSAAAICLHSFVGSFVGPVSVLSCSFPSRSGTAAHADTTSILVIHPSCPKTILLKYSRTL